MFDAGDVLLTGRRVLPRPWWTWLCGIVSLLAASVLAGAEAGPVRGPLEVGGLHKAERAVRDAIDQGRIPGAVLLIGRADGVLYRKAFGNRRVEPTVEAMTVDTVFDLASLTKVVATSTSVVHLIDSGKLKLSDKVATHLPAFGVAGKSDVTVEQLLLHRSGLAPGNAMSQYAAGPEKAIEQILASKPRHKPGTEYVYSDLGYIVLGELVRKVAGKGVDAYAAENVFTPLKMSHTRFNPPVDWKARTAPTDKAGSAGRVHDPRAAALGGVAGHAGLFSTADDLAIWCTMLLNGGQVDAARVLRPEAVGLMLEPRSLGKGVFTRSLALNRYTVHASQPDRTRSHTGFTGTLIWIDPVRRCFLVLLTNRVHLGLARSAPLNRGVIEGVDEAFRLAEDDSAPVLTGIDVLVRDNFRAIRNQRVGLITNHTGLDRFGRRSVDLIRNAPNTTLVALFSPEHGLAGLLDQQSIADGVDKTTGLRVHSLYDKKTRRPTAEMLKGIDTLVFDIQDIGTRYYTYIATMGYAMEAAAEHNIAFVVLDRPNPIAPLGSAGPLTDEDRLAFTSYQSIPLVHGLTTGELAGLFKHAYGVDCGLTVIRMTGWKRSMWWDQTGLTWTNPSPNMRNPTQAVLYPAVGQLEASNLSVGRGTDQPFELFGAPWIDPSLGGHRKLAAALNAAKLPGLRFVPIVFTPTASRHKDTLCGGVFILVTDRQLVRPVEAGLVIAWHLKRLFGKAFEHDAVLRMVRNAAVQQDWTAAKDPTKVPRVWAKPLKEFEQKAAPHLIYR